MVVFGSPQEMQLLVCDSYVPSKQAKNLLASLEIVRSFPIVMSRQLLLPPNIMPGIDFFSANELGEARAIQAALEADPARQQRPEFPGNPVLLGYPPSRSQCGESIEVVNKPGFMFEISEIPPPFQSIMELILHLNHELSKHGKERVYLSKPQAYDWLNQRNLGVVRLVLASGISDEEFILFMGTVPSMDAPAERALHAWDVAMFVHVLIQRYPLLFIGASNFGVFLCHRAQDPVNLAKLNEDIAKLKPSGSNVKDSGLAVQPVYILFN